MDVARGAGPAILRRQRSRCRCWCGGNDCRVLHRPPPFLFDGATSSMTQGSIRTGRRPKRRNVPAARLGASAGGTVCGPSCCPARASSSRATRCRSRRAEMSLPARVEVLAGRDSCGVVVSVEQLVHQARQLLARPRQGSHNPAGVVRLVRNHQGLWNGPRHGGKPAIRITAAASASTISPSIAKISTIS